MKKIHLNELGNPVESLVARVVVIRLLAAGYSIAVNNGEEPTLQASRNYEKILEAMATTDEDHLTVTKRKSPASFVRLIYGNGDDVLSDFGVSLAPILDSVNVELVYDIARKAIDNDAR